MVEKRREREERERGGETFVCVSVFYFSFVLT